MMSLSDHIGNHTTVMRNIDRCYFLLTFALLLLQLEITTSNIAITLSIIRNFHDGYDVLVLCFSLRYVSKTTAPHQLANHDNAWVMYNVYLFVIGSIPTKTNRVSAFSVSDLRPHTCTYVHACVGMYV